MHYLLFILLPLFFQSQNKDEEQIRLLLKHQTEAWNRGNIDEFMKGYWENDSLKFIGKSGITYGYNQALSHYKKTYSDSIKMGKLSFEIFQIKKLSPEYYFLIGKWLLVRSIGNLSGYYTLLFRKIKGKWLIVVDHTS